MICRICAVFFIAALATLSLITVACVVLMFLFWGVK